LKYKLLNVSVLVNAEPVPH